jgi:thioredoxin-dependent peroxiredoxin
MTLTRLAFLSILGAALLSAQAGKTTLKVGDTAPEFTLSSSTGKPINLSDFKGKKTVVLAFFPAAFTGGWTKELTGYQAGIQNFNAAEAQILAVSTDNQPTLNHWAGELKAEYPLLSDFMRKVSASYGVLSERGNASRTTFIIDTEGKIQHIDEGSAAIDVTSAAAACSRIKKK